MFPAGRGHMACGLLGGRGSLAVSWSVGRPWAIVAGRLHLSMKHNNRYLQVVQPGMVSGVAFVTAYEIENFHATANDDLPEAEDVAAPAEGKSNPWARATERLCRVFRRCLPHALWRKAAA